MIKLIAVCTLIGSFTTPDGWTVTKAWAPDLNSPFVTTQMCYDSAGGMLACQPPKASVTLERTVKPGEKVQLPEGCKVETQP